MTISIVIFMKILTKSRQLKDSINMDVLFNKKPPNIVKNSMKSILNHFLREKIKR